MTGFSRKYGGNVYSQNGEDFILEEVINRLGLEGPCVEFGAHQGTYCSNTANLIINHLWDGKLIEGDEMLFNQLINNELLPEHVQCVNAFVTPENVNHLVPECERA
jgi:hypothetical protein